MSKLLLNLRHVPDDEAAEVREMLDEANIAWYETQPGRWGISFGGIWVKHPTDLPKAKQLMAVYQSERLERVTAERLQAERDGTAETFFDRLRREPMRVVLALAGILLLLGILALPGLLLSRG